MDAQHDFLDQVTAYCRQDDRKLWQADPDELTFRLDWRSPASAFGATCEVVMHDELLVTLVWAYPDRDQMLRVGHSIMTSPCTPDLEQSLDDLAQDLPNQLANGLLARL